VTGKVVKELESSGNRELRVSLDGINPGVYFVRVGNEMVKEKLVVTR
jgi:MoaA/NifB/PqqE/SkfB family radical SAM enzyme